MELPFPSDFPAQSRTPVLAEHIHANRALIDAKQTLATAPYYQGALERLVNEFILRVWIAFFREAKKLGQRGVWTLDRMDRESREFLRLLTSRTREEIQKSGKSIREMIDDRSRDILPNVHKEFVESPQWIEFENGFLELADIEAAGAGNAGDIKARIVGEIESPDVAGPDQSTATETVSLAHTDQPASAASLQPVAATLKKRGRRSRFTSEQLRQALEMKQAVKCNNEIAKVLYGTKSPTPEQRRSVPTTLRHHFPTRE